jgi:hypothetical protein
MMIVDDAIPPQLLRSLAATWPEPSWRGWHHYQDGNSVKRATRDAEMLPRAAWPCLYAMAETITHPVGFPDWELHGAGLHEMPVGGRLGRHLDSDVMPSTGWRRELSCVLFLNECQGGEFVIADQRIAPKFNRLIVFATTDDAWHEVLPVRGEVARRSLSVFYWSTQPTRAERSRALFAGE